MVTLIGIPADAFVVVSAHSPDRTLGGGSVYGMR